MIHQNKLASLGELTGSIAHELNNPLAIIIFGFTQGFTDGENLVAETKKGVKNIYDDVRSQEIIKNML